jgi:hypothetical protein
MNRQAVIDYIVARAKEPSTWRGVVVLLTGLGVSLKPEFAESIVTVGALIAGGIAVATSDKPGKPTEPPQQ